MLSGSCSHMMPGQAALSGRSVMLDVLCFFGIRMLRACLKANPDMIHNLEALFEGNDVQNLFSSGETAFVAFCCPVFSSCS